MDDSAIVDLYLCRDEAAIEETSRKYGKRLYSLSFGIVGDRQTAEECQNDAYLEAWNGIPPNEPRDYLYAFLARIIRHISLNRCRDRARLKRSAHICELTSEMEQCIPSADDCDWQVEDGDLASTINGFLATLSDEKRNIFVRRYWYLDSIAALAERFSCSEGRIKTILFRCRKQLKALLEKEVDSP